MKKVSIVGGGIIGLCSAYYLSKEGYEVTIFDSSDMSDGCSYGNAGMIVPSHVIPMAQPGMITQGIKWMFDSKSPFYVKPRLSKSLIKWGLQFYKYATPLHVSQSMPALRDLGLLSKELYQDLNRASASFFYEEKGLLMLYTSDKLAEEIEMEGRMAAQLGLQVNFLSKQDLRKLETGTRTAAIGGVHYKCDAHLHPQKFMQFIKAELLKSAAVIYGNTVVIDFIIDKTNGKVKELITNNGNFATDEVVLATGAWSPAIARKLGTSISILPGKGYSFTLKNKAEKPEIPSILCEGKVAVTPMNGDIRFGGTMEITHTGDTRINQNRLQGIVNTINTFYPDLKIEKPEKENTWFGFRPCTPSGLPIIARDKKVSNVVLATGHAMMGLSLAPATGKLVTEIIAEKQLSVSTKMFQL
jgi:D-amino-acid dehydrogenase